MLSPVVLFVYNRPFHTLKTLEALEKNYLADQSILFIYSDGYPDNSDDNLVSNVEQVRDIIRRKKWCKEVIIFESNFNKGLANSIISGVTFVIKKFGKIIVLEDDLIVSRNFLTFMNFSLDFYQSNYQVMQISGFSFPSPKIDKLNGCFFLPITSTWGWATWFRVWNNIDFDNPNNQNLYYSIL
ncbi:hypothetical protein D0X99_20205 [Algoriphagus lacus]|uniref:Glycosyltransferase n=1 Tax=Algoriphagus lacus TaxID=2056311 RepID=A0A418PL75_9BACT|nr:hypothetical protein [Algoriphagus lacus]RIW11798.1 hypothetical protein D0X99_20205 [Algoriphagus lacus]